MDVKRLSDEISVSSHISPTELAAIRAAGFRSVICHRPDAESPDQPPYREFESAAHAAGLEVRHQSVVAGQLSDEDAVMFRDLLRDLPRPVLAFCRTGTRSATLWALAQAGRAELPVILAATKAAGYDMSGIAGRIADSDRTVEASQQARSV